jgi:hypothetical protein
MICPLKIAIFHGYVGLPESTQEIPCFDPDGQMDDLSKLDDLPAMCQCVNSFCG